MRRNVKIIILYCLLACFLSTNAFSAEKPKSAKKLPSLKSISKKELKERIKTILEFTPEINDFIPELKILRGAEGDITGIDYKIDGFFRSIEKLDKEALLKVYGRISNEMTRIQSERIQRQLEAMRASQNIPKPPQVSIPPSAPKAPTLPPALPQIPKLPPVPPRQPRR